MFSQTWRRPAVPNHPEVWRTFEKTKDGKTLKFKIQTATDKNFNEMIDMMTNVYLPGEVINRSAGCDKSPEFIACTTELIRQILVPQNTMLVCLLDETSSNADGSNEKHKLVGYNMCGVCRENEEMDLTDVVQIEAGANLIAIWLETKKHLPDVFEKSGVKEYIGSLGLCVSQDYRGMSISKEILLARIALCKALGIKATSSLFTGPPSQAVAKKAGFKEDGSLNYTDIEAAVGIKILNPECPSVKLLTCIVD